MCITKSINSGKYSWFFKTVEIQVTTLILLGSELIVKLNQKPGIESKMSPFIIKQIFILCPLLEGNENCMRWVGELIHCDIHDKEDNSFWQMYEILSLDKDLIFKSRWCDDLCVDKQFTISILLLWMLKTMALLHVDDLWFCHSEFRICTFCRFRIIIQ